MKHPRFALLAALFVIMVLALATAATGAPSYGPPGPELPQDHIDEEVCGGIDAPNLLHNPSFEGAYSAYIPPGGHDDCPHGVCNTAQMADGWTPYWRSHDPGDPGEIIRMPEYKPADEGLDPPRTHHGDRAQQYFTFSSTHEAGFYQQVSVTPGSLYCFGIWGHAWSSSDDDAATSDSELEQAVGIDPTGGTNWQSPDIIWGGPKQYYFDADDEENGFGPFSLVVRAQSSQITVFTWSRPIWPVKHNDVYWDDAILMTPPQDPVLTLPQEEIVLLADPSNPGAQSAHIDVDFLNDPGMIWRAYLQAGNTLDVDLAPAAGTAVSDLIVSFDSTGYTPGVYSATVLIQSEPAVPGSPATATVTLRVVDELFYTSIPFVAR